MNNRERFDAIMSYKKPDRVPVYYFGTWRETLDRWLSEGLTDASKIPVETGMDPDWEEGMWGAHGLVKNSPIPDEEEQVLEETAEHKVIRTALGAVIRSPKGGSSIPQHIEEALKPTRESWARFRKFIDPADPRRKVKDWEKAAEKLNNRTEVKTFLAGSLYGWPRDWLGVENVSYLPYDDPALYEEIIETVANFFMEIYRPVLAKAKFDFGYFFEDCCFSNGPLFSPDIYKKFYRKRYKKMLDFYHKAGVKYVLIDSDGKVDDLLPCWLDSGFDIIFPIEVGTWKASPVELKKRFGKRLKMFGGVNKHVIPKGEAAIRAELEPLKPLVEEGGYIPIPDHRIPPDCSLEQFRTYVRVFQDVFNG